MKTRSQPSEIHRLLFFTAKQAHAGVEHWFSKAKVGITPLQFGVLRGIGDGGRTLNDLARQMMFKPPSILPSVDALEKHGYIGRRADPHDRRKIRIEVTAKGRHLMERIQATREPDPLSIAFRNMSGPKRKKLTALLTELSKGIPKK